MKIVAIRRDERYSPNSVSRDDSILRSVVEGLGRYGHEVAVVDETGFASPDEASILKAQLHNADAVVSMARSNECLSVLGAVEKRGALVVNSPSGVRNCRRMVVTRLMLDSGIPMPPADTGNGWWLKRGDEAAQTKDDVVFCKDAAALQAAEAAFRQRGITQMVRSAHVAGDLVKFYGVGDSFFRYYYTADKGISKFGNERRNGPARHFSFDVNALRSEVARLARIVGVTAYGGDAIVDEEGRFYIIDFNDWPSFSLCREEAADEIVKTIVQSIG